MQLQLHAIASQNFLLPTTGTATKNSQVLQVSDELIFPKQSALQRSQQRVIKVDDGTTLPTDKVMVLSLLRRMVSDPAFPQVSLRYQAQSLE